MHAEVAFSWSEHSSPEQPPTWHDPTSMAPVAACWLALLPPHPARVQPKAKTKPMAGRILMMSPGNPHSPACRQPDAQPGRSARLLASPPAKGGQMDRLGQLVAKLGARRGLQAA